MDDVFVDSDLLTSKIPDTAICTDSFNQTHTEVGSFLVQSAALEHYVQGQMFKLCG